MPTIRSKRNAFSEITVPAGTNLMQALLMAKVPVASSCLGDGVCGKCKMKVDSGPHPEPPQSEKEQFLLQRDSLQRGWRISCQVFVHDDLVVDVGYW